MPRLEAPKTIREVAEMAGGAEKGWSYDRMKAHLIRLNIETGGMLLVPSPGCRKCKGRRVDVCPGPHGTNRRYTISLASLKRVAPELFEDTRSLGDRLDDLEEDLKAQLEEGRKAQNAIVNRVGALSRDFFRANNRRGPSRPVGPNPSPSAQG